MVSGSVGLLMGQLGVGRSISQWVGRLFNWWVVGELVGLPDGQFFVWFFSWSVSLFIIQLVVQQPQMYVKPEAAITVFVLLMMSGVSLETC